MLNKYNDACQKTIEMLQVPYDFFTKVYHPNLAEGFTKKISYNLHL